MAEYPDHRRQDVELFQDLFADAAEFVAAAADLFLVGKIMDDLDPGQIFGQGLAARLIAGVRRDDHRFPAPVPRAGRTAAAGAWSSQPATSRFSLRRAHGAVAPSGARSAAGADPAYPG
jgi:hypothetical protein